MANHFIIMTEEPSAEAALQILLPKIIASGHTFKIISHQGKFDLLKHLPNRLKAYAKILNPNERLIILLDRDKDDCIALKNQIETIAINAGLITKTSALTMQPFQVASRIAIEELEAWFLGDEAAVCGAYPNLKSFPATYKKRQPDHIANSWETLIRILKNAGYQKFGGKIEVARKIAAQMTPNNNRSTSFNKFKNVL